MVFEPYHQLIIALVTVSAVNIDDTIPIIRVTAKPLIGPDPSENSITATINVVKFESTIVAKAFSYPACIAFWGVFLLEALL